MRASQPDEHATNIWDSSTDKATTSVPASIRDPMVANVEVYGAPLHTA
jgi:hypothetical protein